MERGLIFTGESVRAILDGTKTQTRRVVKPQGMVQHYGGNTHNRGPFKRGMHLWVREAFRLRRDMDDRPPSQDCWKAGAWYEATDSEAPSGCMGGKGKLRSPIYMPRWASRILLEITAIRVQRVQGISEEDARAEGCDFDDEPEPPPGFDESSRPTGRGEFEDLWDRINAKRGFGWESDPWVWAITFKLLEPELAKAAA